MSWSGRFPRKLGEEALTLGSQLQECTTPTTGHWPLATSRPSAETLGPMPTQRGWRERAGLCSLTSAGPWTQMHLMSLFPGHQQRVKPTFSKPVETNQPGVLTYAGRYHSDIRPNLPPGEWP